MSDWDVVLRGGRVIDPESGLDAVRDVAIAGGPGRRDRDRPRPRPGRVRRHRPGRHGRVHRPAQSRQRRRRPAAAGPGRRHHRARAGSGRHPGGRRLPARPRPRAGRSTTASPRPGRWPGWRPSPGSRPDGRLDTFLANIADPRPGSARPRPRRSPPCWPGCRPTWPTARSASACSSGTRRPPIPGEYLQVAGLAAEAGVPTFTHARDLIEMVAADASSTAPRRSSARPGETGAHMHYCHVNSTSQRHIDRVLGLVGRAQAAGRPGHHRGLPVRVRA